MPTDDFLRDRDWSKSMPKILRKCFKDKYFYKLHEQMIKTKQEINKLY
jgi:hypothetical protein